MATIYAVQSGDWSDTATWDGGVVPSGGDDVYTNDYVVAIDESIIADKLTNKADGGLGISTGGYFTVSDDVSIAFDSFEPGGLGEDGLIQILADCDLLITGDISSGESGGNGLYIGDNSVTEVNLTCSGIIARGDDSAAVKCEYGDISITTIGDVSGSDDGSSVGILIDTDAVLTLTVGGDILGKEATAVKVLNETEFETIISGSVYGGTEMNAAGLDLSVDSASINISGNVEAGSGVASYGIKTVIGAITCNVGGNITGGSDTSAIGALFLSSDYSVKEINVNVIGSLNGGSAYLACAVVVSYNELHLTSGGIFGGSGKEAHGLLSTIGDLYVSSNSVQGGGGLDSTGVVIYDGAISLTAGLVTAGTGSGAYGVLSADSDAETRLITVNGAEASIGLPAIKVNHLNDLVIASGQLTSGSDGTVPILAQKIKILDGEEVTWTVPESISGTTTLTNSAPTGGLPSVGDVRAGVVFGGVLVGTLQIPNPRQVAFGVPVGNTIGEAAILLPQVVNYFGEQIRAAFNLESGLVFIEATVYHGADASKERPNNPGPVIWIGSVEPLNALNGDAWIKE